MKGYNSDYGGGGGIDGSESGLDYNSAGSSAVGRVDSVEIVVNAHEIPITGAPNSVTKDYKDGKLKTERYYGEDGKAYLDIDYTDHGNSKTHPHVPHQHKITFDDDGNMHRDSDDTEVN